MAFAEVGFKGVADSTKACVTGAVDGSSRISVHEPPDGDERAKCGTRTLPTGYENAVFVLQFDREWGMGTVPFMSIRLGHMRSRPAIG